MSRETGNTLMTRIINFLFGGGCSGSLWKPYAPLVLACKGILIFSKVPLVSYNFKSPEACVCPVKYVRKTSKHVVSGPKNIKKTK